MAPKTHRILLTQAQFAALPPADQERVDKSASSANTKVAGTKNLDLPLYQKNRARPAWAGGASAAARQPLITLNGVQYKSKPASENQFYDILEPVVPASVTHANAARPFDPAQNKLAALDYWGALQKSTLNQSNEAINHIEDASNAAQDAFLKGDHPDKQYLEQGIKNYIDSKFPWYLLFNVTSKGHKKFKDFLASMKIKDADSPETLDAYWNELKNHYTTDGMDGANLLKNQFERTLQFQSNALNAYLDNGVSMSDVTVVHGVCNYTPEKFSIAVNTKALLTNFIKGNPLYFKTPISTSAESNIAFQFANHANMEDQPPTELLNVRDKSPENQARCRAMIREIEKLGDGPKNNPAIVYYFRCNGAKGNWLRQNPTEYEVLMAKSHLADPEAMLKGPDYYILVSELSHALQAPGNAS